MDEIWVVAFSDNNDCYVGETALFANMLDAKDCFKKRRAEMYQDYKDEVDYWEGDDYNCVGYADAFANDTVCSLSMFPRKIDGKWQGNLDW